MDYFEYKSHKAFCEEVSLEKIAQAVGTPVYVYSRATLHRHCRELMRVYTKKQRIEFLPCYAIKANANLSILKEIFSFGYGADVVSLGELESALEAGVDPKKVVFSGVGKQPEEITRGLELGILAFNVESLFELELLEKMASPGQVISVSLRVNPNIDAKTNPKITTGLYDTKFGISEERLSEALKKMRVASALKLVGLSCHIGSQILDIQPLKDAAKRMVQISEELKINGFNLEFIDMGGGLGIRYHGEEIPPSLEHYAQALLEPMQSTGLRLIVEPGRVIVGNAGVLMTKVLGVKKSPKKNFMVVDAAMNDLMRPSLYDAYHEILPLDNSQKNTQRMDVVGPICESSDVLGKERDLPQEATYLWIRGAGAYGASMASNYNSRPRAAEVLVDGKSFKVIRERGW